MNNLPNLPFSSSTNQLPKSDVGKFQVASDFVSMLVASGESPCAVTVSASATNRTCYKMFNIKIHQAFSWKIIFKSDVIIYHVMCPVYNLVPAYNNASDTEISSKVF